MAAVLFTLPKVIVFDANGALESGAKANFFITGTTTRQDTFTDKALSIAHDNPVVADGNGVFAPIYLDDTKNYKVDITDSLDVSLAGYPVDDIATSGSLSADLASTANAKGASLVGIEDTANNFGAVNVEAALAEILSNLAANTNALGASLVGIEDPLAQYTATTVEAALEEIGIYKRVKVADETRTNTAALANDADLVVNSLATGTIYKVEALIIAMSTSATPDIKWKFNTSQIPQAEHYAWHEIDEAAAITVDAEPFWNTQRNTTLDGTNRKIFKFEGILHTHASSTTNFPFQFAQNTSNGTATTVELGSWMTVQKMGTA